MNILFFLSPKQDLMYVYDDFTLRQTLEKWENNRYASIPVLNRKGEYVGTLTEGDILWGLKQQHGLDIEAAEDVPISSFAHKRDYKAVTVTTSMDQLIEAALENQLDGLNIDFENLGEELGDAYIEFLRELSVQCRKNGLVLSSDNTVPRDFSSYYQRGEQAEVVDYFIIMGYDEHWHGSKDPGSVASISYVSGGLDRTLQEVPANKVVNALPFYTILWKTEGTDVTDEYITMNNEADFMSRAGVTAEWDEETCQNYAEWTSGNATYQIWLEDAQSIAEKVKLIQKNNLAGVAQWKLGFENSSIWQTISDNLQAAS